MGSWLTGWGLGLSVAAPIGPINIATLQLGLSHGFTRAAAFGLGAAMTDALYCLAVYVGVGPLLVAAPWLRIVLYLAGAILLSRMGWSALRRQIDLESGMKPVTGGPLRSFASGMALTAINPATILSWLAIGGAALSSVPTGEGAWLVVGIFTGSASWFSALSIGASLGRRAADERKLRIVSMACGLALLGFALVFAWQGVREAMLLTRR